MKKSAFWITLVSILVIILIFLGNIVGFIINIQWFTEVGYLNVYFTKLKAIAVLAVPIFLFCFLVIWVYYRSLRASTIRYAKVREIRPTRDKIEKRVVIIADLVVSLIIALSVSSNYWYRILQFTNSVNFNVKDPIFGIDISFFVFRLPLIESLYGVLMSLLVLLVVITFVTYIALNFKDIVEKGSTSYYNIDFKTIKSEITRFAGKQLAILSALILLLLSFGYVIKAINLVYSPRGVVFGASYTDVNITLNFYKLLVVACIIAAAVIFISILRMQIKPIVVSIVVIFALVIVESISAVVVQQLFVKANEKSLEAPYIQNNINYTRMAFNINNVDQKSFDVNTNLTLADITANQDTISNIKINSFKQAQEFYNQVQVKRNYYIFNDVDVDRYKINGIYNQVFLSAREINLDALEGNAATWQNKHLTYTHGYGVVMSKVNSVTTEGQPDFVIKDIPADNTSGLTLENQKIYYGEKTNDYAIVNTDNAELDYPKGAENATNHYDGKTGIKMNFVNKLLFAFENGSLPILTSSGIKDDSKMLINRNIMDRVSKIAPFLTYDKDPYLVISGGKLFWIIDAYTTSDRYPYSQPQGDINYIRNSVKVTVDAYDGTTKFYIFDKTDPIVMSYSQIFQGLFKDSSEMPADLLTHIKYPQDLFDIQSQVLSKYHVTDPSTFYNSEDLWEISQNQKQINGEKTLNESSYITMKLPGETKEEMVISQYFNMRGRDNMVSMVVGRMDGANYGKLVSYRYPTEKTVYSPILFKQNLNQDTTISQQLSLWNKEGSEVQFGDTTILPINNSLLYIEPMYLRASGQNSIPEMKRVIVAYSDKMVMATDMETALQEIFNPAGGTGATTPQTTTGATGTTASTGTTDNKAVIKDAKDNMDKAIEAQKAGDWASYGSYLKKAQDDINTLNK